jgi:hypothetical protein
MEYQPYSLDLAWNDLRLLLKIKSDLMGRRFQDIEDISKCGDCTESFSTTGVPEMFRTVAISLG